MKRAPAAATLRRLAPLTIAVAAVHLLLLQPAERKVAPAPPAPFFTRTVAPLPPPPPPAAIEAAATALPAPRPRPRPPAPRPVAVAQAAAPVEPTPPLPPPSVAPPPAPPGTPVPGGASASVAPPAPVALPPPVRLHYEVQAQARGFTLSGKAELTWRHDDRSYEARLEASALGRPRVQRSVGRVTPQGLAPDYFSDKSRSEQATHFDRDRSRLVFSNNKPEAELAEGMQDRLSVVLQLASLVAGAPERYATGTTITVPTAGTSDAENWVFSVEGEEDLQLPGGAVRALKLQRLPRKEYDQKVELWLAPRMDYAPVRLRLTNPNGDAVEQRWSSTDRG